MRRATEASRALRRLKVGLATLVLVGVLPGLLRAACSSASRAVTTASTAAPASVAPVPKRMGEATLLFGTAAERNATMVRGGAWEDPVVPHWLIGRPRCEGEEGPHCAFMKAVWLRLRGLHDVPIECPPAASEVVGCDLAWQTGMGHHLHVLGHCLTRSLMRSRPVLMLGADWSYGRGCAADHLFECFFESFGDRCEEVVGMPLGRGVAEMSGRRTRDGVEPANYVSWGPNSDSAYWISPELRRQCPHPDPPLALKAAVLRFGAGLRTEVFVSLLSEWSRGMQLRRPYAALHIRRGDKVGTEAERHELHEYLEALLHLLPTPLVPGAGPKLQVFVATDDPAVLAEGREHFSSALEFVALPEAASLAARGYSTVQGAATRLTLGDVAFLAGADYFVGTFSSQISRLAFELMTAGRSGATYCYNERAAPEGVTPVLFRTSTGIFRLPGPGHIGMQVRAASLDSGYYYGVK